MLYIPWPLCFQTVWCTRITEVPNFLIFLSKKSTKNRMSTMALHSTGYLTNSCSKMGSLSRHQIISASRIMSLNPNSPGTRKKEVCTEFQRYPIPLSETETTYTSNLHFERLQLSDEVLHQEHRLEFGQFMAHEAVLDEKYWTAAWLRAESHWEDRQNNRYINNYKRKYAEQEFNALKRRCKTQIGQRCICIVAVRTEDKNIRHTVLKSVVGTLDLIIGHLSQGEAFPRIPQERVNVPVFCNIERRSSNRYGYIANLCVAKSSHRQGVARNMLHFAIRLAKANGAEKVYVHVHTNNRPAQKLYQKVGFEVVEVANLKLSDEQPHLLFLSMKHIECKLFFSTFYFFFFADILGAYPAHLISSQHASFSHIFSNESFNCD